MFNRLALAVAALLAVAWPGAAASAREFRAADTQTADYPTVQALIHMDRLIQERTGGRHSIRVFHSRQLGEEKETIEQTRVGAIDINLAGVVRAFRHAREGGVLHFQALDTSPMGVVANVPNIVLGTPILGRKVYDDRARHVRIVAEDGEILNPVIDGEQFFGLTRVDLTLGPRVELPTFNAN